MIISQKKTSSLMLIGLNAAISGKDGIIAKCYLKKREDLDEQTSNKYIIHLVGHIFKYLIRLILDQNSVI